MLKGSNERNVHTCRRWNWWPAPGIVAGLLQHFFCLCACLCLCVTMCTQHSCTCMCERKSGRKRQCIQSGSFLICRHYIPFHWFPGLWRTGFRRGKICERSGQTGHGDAGLWIWTARGTTKISSRVLWLHRRWGQALFFLERVSRSTHLMFSQCYLKKSMANPLWRFCAIVDSLLLREIFCKKLSHAL